jgi:hypothetical protein
MAPRNELYKLEIPARPRRTWSQILNGVLFGVIFNLGCIMMNAFQFCCLLPLRLLPFAFAKRMYDAGVRLSKGSFGVLLCEFIPRYHNLYRLKPSSIHVPMFRTNKAGGHF